MVRLVQYQDAPVGVSTAACSVKGGSGAAAGEEKRLKAERIPEQRSVCRVLMLNAAVKPELCASLTDK